MTDKKCPKCGRSLPVAFFHNNRAMRDGLNTQCKDCHRKRMTQKAQTPEGKERHWAQLLRSGYGVPREKYYSMLLNQSGKCAICGNPPDGKPNTRYGRLHVDHNHSTDTNRDLLCAHCNWVIGCFYENTEVIRSAIAYLEKWNHTKIQ